MIDLVLTSVYFILPAYFANMLPVLFAKLKLPLGKPVSEKLFGKNKTIRGLCAAFFGALMVLFVQKYLQEINQLENFRLLDYRQINLVLWGFLFGMGAILGDLVESFFKRRMKIKPGRSWFPFDQLDFIIGSLVFTYPFYRLDWEVVLIIVFITPLLHFLANLLAYFFGLKKVWW